MVIFDIILYLVTDFKKDMKTVLSKMETIEKIAYIFLVVSEILILIILNLRQLADKDILGLDNKKSMILFSIFVLLIMINILVYKKIRNRIQNRETDLG